MSKFKRHPKKKKLGNKWRKPKGTQNKMRKKKKGKGKMPSPGYGKKDKGKHPSGFYEKLVHNLEEIENVDTDKEAIRISRKVGKKKKEKILKKAEKEGIKVLNP